MNNYNDSQVKIKKLNCSSLPNKEKPEFNKIKPKIFLKKEFSYYNTSEESISLREAINTYINTKGYHSPTRKYSLPPIHSISPNKENCISLTNNNSLSFNNIYKNIINQKKDKCKIIPIIKSNNNQIPKKITIPKMNLFSKKNSSNSLLKNKLNSLNITKRSPSGIKNRISNSNSPPQKLYIDCYNPYNFSINKTFGYSRAGLSDTGSIKTNQDSYLILRNIFNLNYNILGILDGHGIDGHFVSQFIKDEIIKTFSNEETFKINKKNKDEQNEEIIYSKLIKNNNSFIKETFKSFDQKLQKENFDSKESGTTCVILIQISKYIICANTGDSRCILVKKASYINNNNRNNILYENLSNDHKPNNPTEKKRIIEKGGEVHQRKNSLSEYEGVFRIYEKGQQYPGLAVSRTLGDLNSKLIGNICEPDIIIKTIDNRFKCVVLGSDGLWDVLNGDDVIDEIYDFEKNNNFSCDITQNLVSKAVRIWGEECLGRDDISVVVGVFGKKKLHSNKVGV